MAAALPIAIGASAVAGAGASIIAGNKAAKATKNAASQADATTRYMYDQNREDQAPYRDVGQGALYKLADMAGISRPADVQPQQGFPEQQSPQTNLPMYTGGGIFSGSPSLKDLVDGRNTAAQGTVSPAQPPRAMTSGYDGFQASPGYQFRLDEGVKAAEHSAAARGLLGSGATMKAIQRYGEGLASSEYENYSNRLAALAGIGQTSTAQTGAAGTYAANNISQNQLAAGNARASAYATTGAAINNGVSNGLSSYLRYGQGGGGSFSLPSNFGGGQPMQGFVPNNNYDFG